MDKKGLFSKFALCFSSVLFFAVAHAEKMNAVVKNIEGSAEYALPGSVDFQLLTLTTVLPYGTTIKTGEGSSAIIRVVPGAAMQVAEKTTVVIDGMEFEKQGEEVKTRKARVNLTSGTVSALLDKRNPKATDFRIETPQGSAAARGTFYGVSVTDGQTFVSVKEGKVGVAEKPKDEPKAEGTQAADAKTEEPKK